MDRGQNASYHLLTLKRCDLIVIRHGGLGRWSEKRGDVPRRRRNPGISVHWCPLIALVFALLALPGLAQNQPVGVVRTPLAAGHLASVVDMPFFFRLYEVHLPAAQHSLYAGSNAMLYVLSGALSIHTGATAQTLGEGSGAFIAAGQGATVSASDSEPANFLAFDLSPRPNQRQPLVDRPAAAQEGFRTSEPLPGLKPGPYDFSLTRVIFPAGMPANPPHYRSGAALYFVLAGSGAITADGKTQPKPAGTAHFEPAGWVHQWANPGDAPLTLLIANVSQEGSPAVVPAAQK